MDRKHKNIIARKAVELTSDLRITPEFTAILYAKKKLSENDMEWYAMDCHTSRQKSSKFQREYIKRGPEAFEVLIDALVQTDQNHLARLLDPTLTDKYEKLHSEVNANYQEQSVATSSEIAVPSLAHEAVVSKQSINQATEQSPPISNPPIAVSPGISTKETTVASIINGQTKAPLEETAAAAKVAESPCKVAEPTISEPSCKVAEPTISEPSCKVAEPTICEPPCTSVATLPSEEAPSFNITSLQSTTTVTATCSLFNNPPDTVDSNAEKAVMDINVQTTTAEKIASLQKLMKSGDAYNIKNSPRGKCVIFNNEFVDTNKARLGSKFDMINLKNISENLNFEVASFTNRTAEEMKSDLESLRKQDYTGHDAIIIAIMSHGSHGKVSGNDNKPVVIDEEILQLFDGQNCPSLSGKPKIFIFQACQGSGKVCAVPEADDEETDQVDAVPSSAMAAMSLNSEPEEPGLSTDISLIPHTADMLKACATVKGYVSWRVMNKGSWFIRAIASVFAEFAHEEDIVSLFERVHRRVSEQAASTNNFIQMPCIERHTLRRKFYFMPGYSGADSAQHA